MNFVDKKSNGYGNGGVSGLFRGTSQEVRVMKTNESFSASWKGVFWQLFLMVTMPLFAKMEICHFGAIRLGPHLTSWFSAIDSHLNWFCVQTWNLSKILYRRIFRLISTVLVRKNTKNKWKWRNLHRWQKFYTAAGSDSIDEFHLCLCPGRLDMIWGGAAISKEDWKWEREEQH